MSSLTIAGEGGQPSLEGSWIGTGERAAIVAPPHPLLGGHLSNPVVQALAMGLGAGGVRALLFNWRGVGDSQGNASGEPDDAEQDYLAALGLASRAAGQVVAAGYSFGAAAALRIAARDARVGSAIAVAPPPALLAGCPLERLGGRFTVIAAEHDGIAPASELSPVVARAGGRLEVLSETDHFFAHALARVSELARDALT